MEERLVRFRIDSRWAGILMRIQPRRRQPEPHHPSRRRDQQSHRRYALPCNHSDTRRSMVPPAPDETSSILSTISAANR